MDRITIVVLALLGAGCASSHRRGEHIYAVKQCNARAAQGLPDEDGRCAEILGREDRRQRAGRALRSVGGAYTAAGTP